MKTLRLVFLGSSAVALFLGGLVWAGVVPKEGLGLHELMGYVALFTLWGIAFAARGLPGRVATKTAALGFLALAISLAQWPLLAWSGLWMIQALHLATWLVAIAWTLRVARSLGEAEAAADSGPGLSTERAAAEFLAKKRIAITGVSRKREPHGSNTVYRRLRERGYQVFAVNPNASEVEGDRAYPDLKSIPGGVEAVMIGTRPEHAMATMQECSELGIRQVWMHRSVDAGSVSSEATAWGRARGIRVIDGGCPLMFAPASDAGHKVMRPLLTLMGRMPRRVT